MTAPLAPPPTVAAPIAPPPTVAPPALMTLADYLAYENSDDDRPCELNHGVLTPMPPESRLNARIAMRILRSLMAFFPDERLGCKDTEVAVMGHRATVRVPDVLVLSPELAEILEQRGRSTVLLEMPPPVLAIEVVSPGKAAADRDYRYKRSEYAARGIGEYWIVDPVQGQVTVLVLVDGFYEARVCQGDDRLESPLVPDFPLTVQDILS
ncbi:MAG: Uma2 family endonuclease [Prochlorothrix sp.]|nr:Uma2 family endonuclease [Prochlorothrix sp.]